MAKNRNFVYEAGGGAQIGVVVWEHGVSVMVRPTPTATWGPPLKQVREDGDPVQFAFETEEDEYDAWEQNSGEVEGS